MDGQQNKNQPPTNQILRPPRVPIRMVVERTVMNSTHGNKANVNPILELTKVDHHFVPSLGGSTEDLQIIYKIRGYENEEVKLRISNTNHTPAIVYERPLTSEERKMGPNKLITWDGATNCTSGTLKGKLINPMFGKYKVELVHRRKTTPALETHVIFRELKVEQMTWAEVFYAITKVPAARFPKTGSKAKQWAWVQYKLNELGYYAGPILGTSVDLHAVMRAIFRYTQEHPDFPTIYDFKTLDSGAAPGKSKWGWLAEWAKIFGPIGQLFQQPLKTNIAKLIDRLEKNEGAYEEVLEDKGVFERKRSDSRLFVDHNIFSQNKDFAGEDAHADYDAEFCNRAVLPLKAKALLLSRTDEDASKPGVESLGAVGEFECEWRTFDPPEDISVVPPAPNSKVRLFTRARTYLDTVHRKVDGKYGDPLDTQDNCPPEYGGFRPADAENSIDFFSSMAPAAPSRIENGKRFYVKANWDSTYPPGIYGTNCATFHGSYIAGDNYIVQARLAFEKLADPIAREVLGIHNAIEGLKPSLKRGLIKSGDPERSLIAQSGELTIWRRTAVAQVLDWGPSNYPPIEWFKVVDVFRAAHIHLTIPEQGIERLDAVLDAQAKTEVTNASVRDARAGTLNEPQKTEFTTRHDLKAFNPNGFFPLPMRTLVDYESSTLFVDDNKGSSKKARFNRYAVYLAKLIANYPSFDYLKGATLEIRKAYDRLRSTPGIIILRTAYLPKPDWSALLPPDILSATRDEQAAFNPVRGMSVGVDYGVVILDAGQYVRFTDEFFFSHEIAHCLFGSHAFEATSVKDHDGNDRNCIMYYGTTNGNKGEGSGWGLRVPPSREYSLGLNLETFEGEPKWAPEEWAFKGKSIGGMASRGKLSGKFLKDPGSTRDWFVTGSLETVQKALNELKFEPKVVFTDKSTKPNLYIALKLLPTGGLEPKSNEGLLPLGRSLANNSATTRPFANVKLEPFNLKENEPRFCGKCLLKLRGWKIRTFNTPTGATQQPDPLPEKSQALPTNPKMEFIGFFIEDGSYFAQIGAKQDFVDLAPGKTDPQDPTVKLGPLRFLHKHKFSWESTDGKMSSLKGIKTREYVKFLAPTQTAPFSVGADPDQEFYQDGDDGSYGSGTDDHSIRLPSLICAYPLAAGTLMGEQWYQYQLPGEDWENIPGAAFLLEKTVYQNNGNWILKFKKTNWEPHNMVRYSFEVHYLIGSEPVSQPIAMNLGYNPTPGNPYVSAGATILVAGTQKIGVSGKKPQPIALNELVKMGFIAPRPWL